MKLKPSNKVSKRKPQAFYDYQALEKENLRLQKEIARLKAKVVTVTNCRFAEVETMSVENMGRDELEYILKKTNALPQTPAT